MAEEWFGNVLVSNLGLAAALVQFYGCRHTAATPIHTEVNQYSVVAQAGYAEVMADTSLIRDGLRAFLERHTERAG